MSRSAPARVAIEQAVLAAGGELVWDDDPAAETTTLTEWHVDVIFDGAHDEDFVVYTDQPGAAFEALCTDVRHEYEIDPDTYLGCLVTMDQHLDTLGQVAQFSWRLDASL